MKNIIFWYIFSLVLSLSDRFPVLAVLDDEPCDYEISEIKIAAFQSENYIGEILEVSEFSPPFIRITFSSFNQQVVVSLQKEKILPNSTVILEVRGDHDYFSIDWDPPFYKTMSSLNNRVQAMGVYNRRANTFTGVVVLDNVTYHLEPAKYRFSEYRSNNKALIVSEVHGLMNISSNYKQDDIKARWLCEMEVIGDRTFFQKMNSHFIDTAIWMFLHVMYADNIFIYQPFDSNIIRLFPKKLVVYHIRLYASYHNISTMLRDFGHMYNDYCISSLLTFRRFPSSPNTSGLARVGHICCNRPSKEPVGTEQQYNKLIVSLNYKLKLTPLCMSQIVFAHEVGHTFGSDHDPSRTKTECTPAFNTRNIMYPFHDPQCNLTSPRFSPCSIRTITNRIRKELKLQRPCLKKINV